VEGASRQLARAFAATRSGPSGYAAAACATRCAIRAPASDIWNRSQRHDDQLFNYRALADGQCDLLLATSHVSDRRAGRVGRQLAVDVEAVT
jgi:hypothetical protein